MMVQDDIRHLIKNQSTICVGENFIGLGSTRKVYRYKNYVVKVHLNEIGYLQSLKEQEIYDHVKDTEFSHLFSPVYHVDIECSIQRFFNQIPLRNEQSFNIYENEEQWIFPVCFHECMTYLDEKWDSFDIKDSSNFGLNGKNELVLIDYGMTKSLYENKWVPAAEKGEIPEIEVKVCHVCKIEKEIRMCGEDDHDIRCITCGKE